MAYSVAEMVIVRRQMDFSELAPPGNMTFLSGTDETDRSFPVVPVAEIFIALAELFVM